MASGIYEIVNLENGKRYIGSAKNFAVRWRAHRAKLRKGDHHNRHLQASWSKHSEAAFEFRVIEVCEVERLIEAEQRAINKGRPEYNLSPTAGSTLGVRFTDEAKRKIGAALKGKTLGRKRDRAAVEKGAAAHRGRRRPKETGQKISAVLSGRKRDPKAVEASAAKLRGRKLPPEHVVHLVGDTHALGHKDTDEQRAAKSARQMGRPAPKSPEHRAKLAAALRGIPHSAERRAKQAAAQLGKKRGPYKKRAASI